MNLGLKAPAPGQTGPPEYERGKHEQTEAKVQVTEDIREWDYGVYEGITSKEIREQRRKTGEGGDKEWDIWRDGCPGGE